MLRGFTKPRNESTLREPLPGNLPLKPSLAYRSTRRSSFATPCHGRDSLADLCSTYGSTLLARYGHCCVILEQTFVNDARGLALRLAKDEGRSAWSFWVSTPVWPIRAGGLSRSDVARFAAVPTVVSRPARAARSRCACRISPTTSRASSNATVPIPRLSRASTLALTSARPSPRRMPAVPRSWRFRSAHSRLANTRPCRSSRPWWHRCRR